MPSWRSIPKKPWIYSTKFKFLLYLILRNVILKDFANLWQAVFLFSCFSLKEINNTTTMLSFRTTQPTTKVLIITFLDVRYNKNLTLLSNRLAVKKDVLGFPFFNLIIILTIRKLSNDLPLYMNYYHLPVNFD